MSLSGSGGAIASAFVEISADTRQFQQQLDSLISNLSRLTLTVQVDADTGQVTVDTERAVANADTTADIDAETSGVSGQITSAVDNADSTLDVDADTAGVSSQISSAVDNADTSIDIDVESNLAGVRAELSNLQTALANSESQVQELRDEVERLGRESEDMTEGMGVGFRRVVAIVGGALAGAFAQAGIQFNELQQTSRAALTTLLGGAEAATAQLAELNEFASESPFPRQQFLQAQQTLIAFGTAAEDVVPTLSAIQDALAASGQSGEQIGELAIIFGQIQSAGRITAEELNQFAERGVNAAQLIGDQMGLTAGEIREQITAGALDAETALRNLRIGMQEEFEGAAAGVRETFAGARDRVRAALRDISSDLFSTFVDPQGGGAAVDFFNDLADAIRLFSTEASSSIGDAGASLVPILQTLGQDLLPAVALSLAELAPLFGTTGTLAQGAVPAIQLLGAGLEAIPGPVLQAATAFALLNRVGAGQALVDIAGFARIAGRGLLETVSSARQAGGALTGVRGAARGAGTAIAGLATSMGTAGVVTAGLAAGMALLALEHQRAAQQTADQKARVDTLRQALAEADTAAEGLELGLERLAEEGDESARGVAAAGLSADDMQRIVRDASDSTDALVTAIDEAGISSEASAREMEIFAIRAGEGERPTKAWAETVDDATSASLDQIRAIDNQIDFLNELAEQEIDTAVTTNQLTDETAEHIRGAENVAQAWFEWRTEMEAAERVQRESTELTARQQANMGNLTDAQLSAVQSAESAAEAEDILNDALRDTTDAAGVAAGIMADFEGVQGRAANQARDVADALSQVDAVLTFTRDASSDAGESFIGLDTALETVGINMDEVDGASGALELSMANLAVAIDAAGLSGEELEEIAQSLGVNVNDLQFFVEQTAGVINDFVGGVESNIPTVSDALGELDELTLTGVRDSVLDTLDAVEQFADDISELSIRPAIQRLAIEEGPELAAVLANAQRDGNDAMLDEIEQGLIDFDNARQGLIEDAQVFALEFAIAMGFIAENGVEAFAEAFDIESDTLDELNRTGDALSDAATSRLAEEGGRAGRSVVERYGDEVSGMIPESARNSRAAASAIEAEQIGFQRAGFVDGKSADIGFGTGISGMPTSAGSTADSSVFALRSRAEPAKTAGLVVGNAAEGGVVSGISGVVAAVRDHAKRAANAPREVDGFSGGKALGDSISGGIVAGISAGFNAVTSAAVQSVNNAVAASEKELDIRSPSRVFQRIGRDVADGLALGIKNGTGVAETAAENLAAAVAGVNPAPIPVGTLGNLQGGGVSRNPGSGGTVIEIQRGAIQINADRNTTPEHVRQLTRSAEQGFTEALARRQVIVDSRTA